MRRIRFTIARLITTKALTYLDSKVPKSNAEALYDPLVANNSQQSALYRNKTNTGWFLDAMAAAGLVGSSGTTENFVRIGHSLLALIAAFLGGQLSRSFFAKNRELASGSVNPPERSPNGSEG